MPPPSWPGADDPPQGGYPDDAPYDPPAFDVLDPRVLAGAAAAAALLAFALRGRLASAAAPPAAARRAPPRILPARSATVPPMGTTWDSAALRELAWDGPVGPGARGTQVKRVQEWLKLRGHDAGLDAVYGGTVSAAVRAFQREQGLPETGVVDPATYGALSAPLRAAFAPLALPAGTKLGAAAVAVARQHIAQHPREVTANGGPWVRSYMTGHDGTEWAWCAGYAGTMMRHALVALGVANPDAALPVAYSWSVNTLANAARRAGRFVSGEDAQRNPALLGTGALFFVRRDGSRTSWHHTGLCTPKDGREVTTFEGNTNSSGGREGVEARTRTRPFAGLDFAKLD